MLRTFFIITQKIDYQKFLICPNFAKFSIGFLTTSRQSMKKEEKNLVFDFDTDCEISLLC